MEVRTTALQAKVEAIDQAVRIYDPNYAPLAEVGGSPRRRTRKATFLPQHLSEINKTESILKILHEADQPVSRASAQITG